MQPSVKCCPAASPTLQCASQSGYEDRQPRNRYQQTMRSAGRATFNCRCTAYNRTLPNLGNRVMLC